MLGQNPGQKFTAALTDQSTVYVQRRVPFTRHGKQVAVATGEANPHNFHCC